MFVDTSKVAVRDGDNTIFVKSRMDFGTTALVQDAIAHIQLKNGTAGAVGMTLGAYNLALMIHNIVGWEGPDFNGVPCDEEHIKLLDPNEPIIDAVLTRINELNVVKKKSANGTASNGGGSGSTASAKDSQVDATTFTSS